MLVQLECPRQATQECGYFYFKSQWKLWWQKMAMCLLILLAVICPFLPCVHSLDNGIARTPPMGWLSWVAFGCNINCTSHPKKCISQEQIAAMADRMVKDGYRDAGYKFVIVDDCWLARERDQWGRLQPDPKRFSKGIKWLADYMHSRNLKFGIYEDYGTHTCAGYPGSKDYAYIDANTFAHWGVDYLKLDGCHSNANELDYGYRTFRWALNYTGRPIVYSCEWPLYTQEYSNAMPNYSAIRENCNLWRNWIDINTNWQSIKAIIDYFDHNQNEFARIVGPGGWNDPDMLIIGNPGLTVDQAKVQMAIWSIWSAPLLMSVDLRTLHRKFRHILLNKKVIAVDQDPLGIAGRLVARVKNVNVYVKPVTPVNGGHYSYAIAFLNRDDYEKAHVTVLLEQLGLRYYRGYVLEDLFDGGRTITMHPKDKLKTVVNPSGVILYKATLAG